MKTLPLSICIAGILTVLPSLAQPPSNPLALPTQLIGQGNFKAAEESLERLASANPENATAHFLLGIARQRQQKWDSARDAFAEAAGQGPQERDRALYEKGVTAALSGKPKLAVEELSEAFEGGFRNVDRLEHDPRLKPLHDRHDFQKLLAEQRADEQLFREPCRVIHRWLGEAAGDEFGWIARRVGDIDQDNAIDFVATAPSHRNGDGKIYVYSSRSGKLLFSVTGQQAERLGNGAAGAGDVDQDGIPDIVVGAPRHPDGGSLYVYSGADGSELRAWKSPQPNARFGYKVCSVGDVDGDGVPDQFAGALAADGDQPGSGAGFIYSGATGKLIVKLNGERTGDQFGSAAMATREGAVPMLAVGAQNAGPNQRGRVYVYRLGEGTVEKAFTIEGDEQSANLGVMFVSFPGDLNGDGVWEVYASDWADNQGGQGAGRIFVHDGATGERIYEIAGTQPGEGFGTSPSDAGDLNGDGIGDLCVGAWQHASGAPSGGRVTLHDGRDGTPLGSLTCLQRDDTFGFDAIGLGDVDGDGHPDLLLTSAWANTVGPRTGRVFLIRGEPNQSP